MKLEHLVSAVDKDARVLVETMNLKADAVIINQTNHEAKESFDYNGVRIRLLEKNERGVGRSRNAAIEQADQTTDICLFSDEDIVYFDGYVEAIITEFETHPEADVLLFNVEVNPNRKTYWNTEYAPVNWKNYGRYPAYAIAIRKSALDRSGVRYSIWFGGGAKYSAGEDSLFLHDLIKQKLKLYKTPVCIGKEIERPSTWFDGYTEKFFKDRGVLYYFLYGPMKYIFSLRFLVLHQKEMCQDVPLTKAFSLMCEGIREAKTLPKE